MLLSQPISDYLAGFEPIECSNLSKKSDCLSPQSRRNSSWNISYAWGWSRPITEPDTLAVVLQSALQYPASVVAGYRIRSEVE